MWNPRLSHLPTWHLTFTYLTSHHFPPLPHLSSHSLFSLSSFFCVLFVPLTMLWHSKALLPSLTLFHEDADDNNWFENRRQWDTRIIPGSHPPPLAPHEDSAALHPPFDFLSMSLSCSSFLLHVFCFITVLTPSPSSLLNPFQTFFLHSLDLSHILMLPSEKKQNKYIMYRKVCDAWVFGCMLVCEEVPACIPLRLNRGRRGWKKRREWKVKKNHTAVITTVLATSITSTAHGHW